MEESCSCSRITPTYCDKCGSSINSHRIEKKTIEDTIEVRCSCGILYYTIKIYQHAII